MSSDIEAPLPHNNNQLGAPLRNPKRRGAVFMVVVISVGIHVLGLGVFGVIKIVETISPPPQFEEPPVVEIETPPPPPPPPPTTKRSRRSLPRPQPLAAQNPQNMSVPAISMVESDLSFGRGMGGGMGDLGGGILDRVDISFFGIEGGNNIVILFDRTGSGSSIFQRTRAELMKTLESMQQQSDSRLAVIYFGGKEAGMRGLNNKGIDPTKRDFWWPKGVRSNTWLYPAMGQAEPLVKELNKFKKPEGKDYVTADPRKRDKGRAFFVLGTNYWGALEAAFTLEPAPDTVYFMVEPSVAFPNTKTVRQSFAAWQKYGVEKPADTKVIFVVGKPEKSVKNRGPLNMMVNLLNGGNLTQAQINELIVF